MINLQMKYKFPYILNNMLLHNQTKILNSQQSLVLISIQTAPSLIAFVLLALSWDRGLLR